MATFETLDVSGLPSAIYGMRLPLKSHLKSDSWTDAGHFMLGPNDYKLAKSLFNSGPEHAKWTRQVMVWVNISAPRYWWSEWDTYKVGTSANSESTMHTIEKRPLTVNDFELPEGFAEKYPSKYETFTNYITFLNDLISAYNLPIELPQDKEYKEDMFRILKACLPESFVQKRTVCLSYATLANIYKQRKMHRLPQWNTDFVAWVKTLPYSEFITGEFQTENLTTT